MSRSAKPLRKLAGLFVSSNSKLDGVNPEHAQHQNTEKWNEGHKFAHAVRVVQRRIGVCRSLPAKKRRLCHERQQQAVFGSRRQLRRTAQPICSHNMLTATTRSPSIHYALVGQLRSSRHPPMATCLRRFLNFFNFILCRAVQPKWISVRGMLSVQSIFRRCLSYSVFIQKSSCVAESRLRLSSLAPLNFHR